MHLHKANAQECEALLEQFACANARLRKQAAWLSCLCKRVLHLQGLHPLQMSLCTKQLVCLCKGVVPSHFRSDGCRVSQALPHFRCGRCLLRTLQCAKRKARRTLGATGAILCIRQMRSICLCKGVAFAQGSLLLVQTSVT